MTKDKNPKDYTVVFSFEVTPEAVFVNSLATPTLASLREGEGHTNYSIYPEKP